MQKAKLKIEKGMYKKINDKIKVFCCVMLVSVFL